MNAVLIILDSLRPDHVGAYGNDWIQTPALDALAGRSARFTCMHPESLPTLPARRAIYTGTRTFPFENHKMLRGDFAGVAPGWGPIEEDRDTLAEILQVHGYATCLVSDVYHMFKPSKNFHRGFDQWTWIRGQEDDPYLAGPTVPDEVAERYRPANLQSEFHLPMLIQKYVHNTHTRQREEDYFPAQVFGAAVDWLERNRDAERFFLTVECFDPHEPWDPPVEYRRLYDDEEVEDLREVIFSLYGSSSQLTERELERMRANYAGEVTLVDRWLGEFLDRLRELGKFDDTLIVVVSDHGHCIGEQGLVSKQGYPMSREIADLVLLLHQPGGAGAGAVCDALCYHHDIPVTVLRALGLDPPQRMTGHDLRAMVGGEQPYDHVTTGWGPFVMVRDRRWWYNAYLWGDGPRLFDLEQDPQLLENIAEQHPEKVERMAAWALEDGGGVIPDYLREVALMNLPGCTPLVAQL